MAKTIFDYMSAEEFETYNAIAERAKAAKAATPRQPRQLTIEQKAEAARKRYEALEAKVQALLAEQAAGTTDGE